MGRPKKREGQTPTWDRVLDAAERAFAQHGFSGASVNDIAAEAGIRGPSLLYHFGSKENLYLQVLRRFYRRVDQMLDAPLSARGTPQQRLRQFGKTLARIERENRELIGVLNRELFGESRGAEVVREAMLPILERVEAFLRDVAALPDDLPLRSLLVQALVQYSTAGGLRASGLQKWASGSQPQDAVAALLESVMGSDSRQRRRSADTSRGKKVSKRSVGP